MSHDLAFGDESCNVSGPEPRLASYEDASSPGSTGSSPGPVEPDALPRSEVLDSLRIMQEQRRAERRQSQHLRTESAEESVSPPTPAIETPALPTGAWTNTSQTYGTSAQATNVPSGDTQAHGFIDLYGLGQAADMAKLEQDLMLWQAAATTQTPLNAIQGFSQDFHEAAYDWTAIQTIQDLHRRLARQCSANDSSFGDSYSDAGAMGHDFFTFPMLDLDPIPPPSFQPSTDHWHFSPPGDPMQFMAQSLEENFNLEHLSAGMTNVMRETWHEHGAQNGVLLTAFPPVAHPSFATGLQVEEKVASSQSITLSAELPSDATLGAPAQVADVAGSGSPTSAARPELGILLVDFTSRNSQRKRTRNKNKQETAVIGADSSTGASTSPKRFRAEQVALEWPDDNGGTAYETLDGSPASVETALGPVSSGAGKTAVRWAEPTTHSDQPGAAGRNHGASNTRPAVQFEFVMESVSGEGGFASKTSKSRAQRPPKKEDKQAIEVEAAAALLSMIPSSIQGSKVTDAQASAANSTDDGLKGKEE